MGEGETKDMHGWQSGGGGKGSSEAPAARKRRPPRLQTPHGAKHYCFKRPLVALRTTGRRRRGGLRYKRGCAAFSGMDLGPVPQPQPRPQPRPRPRPRPRRRLHCQPRPREPRTGPGLCTAPHLHGEGAHAGLAASAGRGVRCLVAFELRDGRARAAAGEGPAVVGALQRAVRLDAALGQRRQPGASPSAGKGAAGAGRRPGSRVGCGLS